jgi:hypothetical protein
MAVGPNATCLLLNASSVAVGNRAAGPNPVIHPPLVGSLGEKKTDCTTSPGPKAPSTPSAVDPRSIIGTIVREMRFQSSLREKGATGCTLTVTRSAWLSSWAFAGTNEKSEMARTQDGTSQTLRTYCFSRRRNRLVLFRSFYRCFFDHSAISCLQSILVRQPR